MLLSRLELEHEASHADVEQQPHPDHGRDHVGATVGEERQRNTHPRQQADDHSEVDDDVEKEHRHHPDRNRFRLP